MQESATLFPVRLIRLLSLGLALSLLLGLSLIPAAAYAAPAESRIQSSHSQAVVYHTVRPGENLSRIAAHYGVTLSAIMQANGIVNANHIYVGQVLVIPSGSWGCARYHTVQPGQTLSHIALYYGVSAHALSQANNITNPNRIYVGQKLCIPATGGPVYPAPPSQPSYVHYTVRVGDTLSAIALRYRVTMQAIMSANGIANPNRIVVGQVLRIPGGHQPLPPAPAPAPHPTPAPTPIPTAMWTGLYYNNTDFSGTPTLIRQDPAINFNWGLGSPGPGIHADQFSVIWTTEQYFSAGTYRFFAQSDDGVRVYVDDRLIIDGWGVHPLTGYFADVHLSAGNHRLRVEYFENFEFAAVTVNWSRR
jgi:LysM repeat protein